MSFFSKLLNRDEDNGSEKVIRDSPKARPAFKLTKNKVDFHGRNSRTKWPNVVFLISLFFFVKWRERNVQKFKAHLVQGAGNSCLNLFIGSSVFWGFPCRRHLTLICINEQYWQRSMQCSSRNIPCEMGFELPRGIFSLSYNFRVKVLKDFWSSFW